MSDSSRSDSRAASAATANGHPPAGSNEDHGFIRALGSVDALFIGFGAMIGFGWITLTGGWLETAGTYGALLAFLTGGIIMSFVGVVYSEMVAAMPHAGGEHNYLMRGIGPKISMLGSWAMTGGYISVVLFEAVSIPMTAVYLFPNLEQVKLWTIADFDVHLTWALVGTISALIVTWINIRGVKLAGLVQTWIVAFLLTMALLLLVGGVVGGDVANTEPYFTGGAVGFIAVLGAVPFLFVGFDVIPQSAEEVKIPPQQVGKLVVVSVFMAVAFYLIIIFATSLALPAEELAKRELVTADALAVLLGHEVWGKIVIAGGVAGIITSWIAFLMGGSRLMWALARSGMIPAWFGQLHPKYRTPANALVFIGVLSAIVPFFGRPMLVWIVDAGSPMIVFAYGLVAVAFIVLRKNEPDMPRPLRVGGRGNGGLAIGVIAAVLCAALFFMYIPELTPISVTLAPQSYLMFGIWMLAGLVLMLRLPGGIKPGPLAEQQLVAKIAERKQSKG
ncbi:APC family permease [Brevibacterium daeguense]|uniref:APC family permease n=1 Tax=Brevibacterium daeguense TaxID=909936 RepID=A0ABP8EJY3_9MICO|nr:APC family permease [Brevibacterium daeguense]